MIIQSNEDGLVFRLSEHTPDLIRQILLERGWLEYNEDDEENEGEWNLWWRNQRFRRSEHAQIAHWQRLNHFPRTDAITRKDCLVRNLRRMRCVHGSSVYDFHPLSYILPNEYTKFVSDYARDSQKKGAKNLYWICKPTDLSRGRGIFVFKDLKDLNYDCPVIVQRYISSPLLISGYKFDMRIYVCVPSFQPLTIYIYQEGIVRFSTDKFDLGQLGNVFSHLTNTSINKYGPAYSTDKERVGQGCKWTLSQLRSFLRQMDNVDETLLWQRISNIVTLTIATQAPTVPKSQSCFELFGFDILVDQNLKPWLLEVNFSPALSMDCQADFIAKHAMLNDLIDLLNFKASDKERGGKSYRECKSPAPGFNPRRSQRYDRTGHRRIQVQAIKEDRDPSTPKVQNYTYSKPTVSKYSPLLLGRFKYLTGNTTNTSKTTKSLSSLSSSRLEKPSPRRFPSIVKNDEDSDKEDSKSSDSGVSSASSIPRNLSSSSIASSQSSVDISNKSGNEDDLYTDVGANFNSLNSPKSEIGGKVGKIRVGGNWVVGADHRPSVCSKETKRIRNNISESNRSTNSNTDKDAIKRIFRTSSRSQYHSKSLPRITPRTTASRLSRTAPSGENLETGDGKAIGRKNLHPIVEATTNTSGLESSVEELESSTILTSRPRTPKITPKTLRKKKNASSAPNSRTPVDWSPDDRFHMLEHPYPPDRPTTQSTSPKTSKNKPYRSPYSIESTKATKINISNPWPRTRVGDFVLTFPWNDTLRKASSGSNFDMKTIIKEQQKILKKLTTTSKQNASSDSLQRRRSSAISDSEALELSFMLKFEDKDANPLYFWGPQNPPLLSSVIT